MDKKGAIRGGGPMPHIKSHEKIAFFVILCDPLHPPPRRSSLCFVPFNSAFKGNTFDHIVIE